MVATTPLEFCVKNETTQLTKPIIFNPSVAAKKTGEPQAAGVSLGSASTSMTLFKAIIGIFLLIRFMTKRTLFSFKKKYATSKPKYAKKQTSKFRLRQRRKLKIPPINSNITS